MLFVSSLAGSVAFYTRLMGCSVGITSDDAVLLIAPGGFQLYLVQVGDRASHPTGSIGNQGITWSTETAAELREFADALRAAGAYTDTHSEGGVTFVEGRDPDDLRVIVTHPSPGEVPRTLVAARLFT